MPRVLSPRGLVPLPSPQAHGIVHSARARRMVIGGQIGMGPDGILPPTLPEQMDVAWSNLAGVLAEGGMTTANLIRVAVYSREAGGIHAARATRDRRLAGQRVVFTYLEVSGLSHPEALVEMEAEAVCEEPDLAFLEQEGQTMGEDVAHSLPYRGARGAREAE